MPRLVRKVSTSKVNHVMFRGNELREIFVDNEDRSRFVQTFFEKAQDENYEIYAYCLMSNHVHLLIAGEQERLGTFIKRINTSYVTYFNKKYERIGHLYHDRYKSEPVETLAYLLEAIRYIHNNPVKAGIVKNPDDYEWSSYQFYINKDQTHSKILKIDYILSLFSSDKHNSVRRFLEFSKREKKAEFIDIKESSRHDRSIKNEGEAKKFLEEYLIRHCLSLNDLKLKTQSDVRNELILQLKDNSNLSIKQIAYLLDINRGIIQRMCQRTVPRHKCVKEPSPDTNPEFMGD